MSVKRTGVLTLNSLASSTPRAFEVALRRRHPIGEYVVFDFPLTDADDIQTLTRISMAKGNNSHRKEVKKRKKEKPKAGTTVQRP